MQPVLKPCFTFMYMLYASVVPVIIAILRGASNWLRTGPGPMPSREFDQRAEQTLGESETRSLNPSETVVPR